MSTINLLQEEKTRKMHGRRVSEETVYSVRTVNGSGGSYPGSRNFGQRRLLRNNDLNNLKPVPGSNSYVAQRVLSAKVLRVKELQNELQQVKNQLHEVLSENKMLRNLQKRQDTALSRYEDSSAALPRLLENHRAEVTTLKSYNKEIKAAARSLHRKLQRSEAELLSLREQYNKLKQIAESKDLDSRTQLQKRVEELEDRLKEMRDKNVNLNRKLEIEQKSHSQQLNAEIGKRKSVHKELQLALKEIARLTVLLQKCNFNVKSGDGDADLQTEALACLATPSCPQLNSSLNTSRTIKSTTRRNVPTKNIANRRNLPPAHISSNKSDTHIKRNIKLTNEKIVPKKEEISDDKDEELHIKLESKTSSESLCESTESVSQENKKLKEISEQELNNEHGEEIENNEIEQEKDTDEINENSHMYHQINEDRNIDIYEIEEDKKREEISRAKHSDEEENADDRPPPDEMFDWYAEEFAENKEYCSTSINSSDVNQSTKSSAESYRHLSSSMEKSDEKNYTTDSSADEETAKFKNLLTKPSFARDINYNELDTEEENKEQISAYRKANPPLVERRSRYTKSTKNNLIKLQDHMNKFDEELDRYVEEKSMKNRSTPYGEVKKGILAKDRSFKNFVAELEETDRMNEKLIASNQNILKSTQKKEDNLYKDSEYEKGLQNFKDSVKRKGSVNFKFSSNEYTSDSTVEVDAQSYIEKIDSSYKIIRARMDEDNALINNKLQQFCKDVESDVQKANEAIDRQKHGLELNRRETEKIERAIHATTKFNDQLKRSDRIDSSKKNQLLAALKAIDSGKDVEDINQLTSVNELTESTNFNLSTGRRANKKQIMKELFE